MERRIRKIVKLAAYKKNNVLVLGAFGCGVFKNNPFKIARIFYQVLVIENMKNYLSSNDTIIKSVFDLIDNDDFKVKSLSIFVAAQISQNHFFSEPILQKLFHLLFRTRNRRFR